MNVGTITATLIPPMRPGTNDEFDVTLTVGDGDALGAIVTPPPFVLFVLALVLVFGLDDAMTPGVSLGDTDSLPLLPPGPIHVHPLSTGRNPWFLTYTVPFREQDMHRRSNNGAN